MEYIDEGKEGKNARTLTEHGKRKITKQDPFSDYDAVRHPLSRSTINSALHTIGLQALLRKKMFLAFLKCGQVKLSASFCVMC